MSKNPLALLIVGSDSINAARSGLIENLIEHFEGKASKPFARPMGVKVRVCSSDFTAHLQRALNGAERVAVLPIIDTDLLGQTAHAKLGAELVAADASDCVRVFPIPLHSNWFKLYPNGKAPQALIRAQAGAETTHEFIRISLMQECIAWLQNSGKNDSSSAFRVFLSHAKADGLSLCTQLRDQIERDWRIEGFFDARDIPAGSEWQKVLVAQTKHSAMLVIQTDAYSEREWCQREVLEAKKHNMPLLLVNALTHGETRAFPYLGNARSVRLVEPKDFTHVIAALLEECLRGTVFLARKLRGRALVRAPELLTVTAEDKIIVYPDPPLSQVERSLLPKDLVVQSWREYKIAQAAEGKFPSLRIAVSASDPSPAQLAALGLHTSHVSLYWLELHRILFGLQIKVAYGGDQRAKGFTQQLVDLVRSYIKQGEPVEVVSNYLIALNAISPADQADLLDAMSIVDIPTPADALRNPANVAWQKARSYTAMRIKMAQETDARILLGGKSSGSSGRYLGLCEEAWLHLQAGKPVYVLGLLGGCAAEIAGAFANLTAPPLADPGPSPDGLSARAGFTEDADSERAFNPEAHAADFGVLLQQISDESSKVFNGLSREENIELGQSHDLDNCLALVLKGLRRRFSGRVSD